MPETPPEGLEEFDTLVAQAMAEWQIPGLAIAMVQKEKPPLLRCWGFARHRGWDAGWA